MKYWIAVASKDHAVRGRDGGFMQVNHGKEAPLKKIKPGDSVIFYAPKITMQDTEKCQAFVGIGKVLDDIPFQVEVNENFKPYRRKVTFYKSTDASILPLIKQLDFIINKKLWGYPFRFGLLEISEKDFNLIKENMHAHEKP